MWAGWKGWVRPTRWWRGPTEKERDEDGWAAEEMEPKDHKDNSIEFESLILHKLGKFKSNVDEI